MADRGDVLDRVTDLLEDKTTTLRSRLEPWVGFVLSEMKQHGLLGPDATTDITLVAGTATYNLPTDLDHLDSVYVEDTNSKPLRFLSEAQFAHFLADDKDLQSTPEVYTLPIRPHGSTQGTIQLYPVPDSADTLVVNYKANFAALTADTDVIDLTDDAFTTVVWGVYRIWTRIEENDDIEDATAEFVNSLRRAKWKKFGMPDRVYTVPYRDLP